MKKVLLFPMIALLFAACRQKIEVNVHYPDKEVHLNFKRVMVSVGSPILDNNSSYNKVSDDTTFPDYTHAIPDTFNVYFIASTGSDQGTVIKKYTKLSSGVHSITVPARAYNVVVTNYSNIESSSDYGRRWLPENSDSLYLYGNASIDFTNMDDGTVTVTNDYAAAMILKNSMVLSVPKVNSTSFFVTDDYYILYMRDQNGGSFGRNVTFSILKRNGGSETYNLNNNYDPNKVYRFDVQMYDQSTGNFNILVDTNILHDTVDSTIVPQE